MAKRLVDLNCDLGESFGHWTISEAPDDVLLDLISSANVATGFHAGDPNLMDRVVRLAAERGVALGAHPGFRDLQGFGRRVIQARPEELVNDIIYQLGALREFARRHGVRLQHVKPHGALYMEVARDETLSQLLVEALLKSSPETYLYCMDVSVTCAVARAAGLPVIREFYADRDYDNSGSIVFARRMRALDPEEVARKCVRACLEGRVRTVEGDDIEIEFESICFHSDTPGALKIGTAIRAGLIDAGIRIANAAEVSAAA
ncbi:MAG: lactam utilization protein LamB [Tistrella sp.]|uniref:Lactam utilization protein LamB n=1 Tax=Tistrella mobilis TaxID=171437 RepID=A0A3B9IGE0_9PROT|nr:5-oxoprolinase subunit PxpA [Tistrella sp.]MAD40035.1 lactam utilization protein LamB [Tistrella sp.]MBA77221.1 lactam utilization protein LamB [Tistrella sp.]HAE46433.1 lactam utilization protein LamB [Tistrella mobilis]